MSYINITSKVIIAPMPDTMDGMLQVGLELGRVQCGTVLYQDELWLVVTDLPSTAEVSVEEIHAMIDLGRDLKVCDDAVELTVGGVWDVCIYSYEQV